MNLEYELTQEDALTFQSYNLDYTLAKNRSWKWLRYIYLMIYIGMFLAVLVDFFMGGISVGWLASVLFVIAFMVAWNFFLFPRVLRKLQRRGFKRIYSQGPNKLTGKHKLSISPNAVTDTTEMGESTTRWNAIEYVASTDQYVFMSARASSPYVVPRRAFANDKVFSQFVEATKAYHRSAMQKQA